MIESNFSEFVFNSCIFNHAVSASFLKNSLMIHADSLILLIDLIPLIETEN